MRPKSCAIRFAIFLFLILCISTPALGNSGAERVFPTFQIPEHLFVVDMVNVDQLLWPTISTLQGIVNRKQPRIYLIYTDHGWTWLEETIAPRGITHEDVTDAWYLLSKFGHEVDGFIVFDPELPDSVNAATTMAGVLNATVVDPQYIPMIEALGIPQIADLRGRWNGDQIGEMYRWVHDTYWNSCSHDFIGYLEPDIHHLRDFLVACRAFTFYSETGRSVDEQLVRSFLCNDDLEGPTPVLGYFTEERGFRIASECGAYVVTCNYAPSLTVHSSIQLELPLVQERPNTDIQLEDKIYVTFMTSPNSLAYNLDFMPDQWGDRRRGDVPMGWSLSPFIYELAPAVAEWYYDRATEADYFVAPPSGIGNMYPSLFPHLGEYFAKMAEVLPMLDLTETWLWNFPDQGNTSLVQRILSESGLRVVFENAPEKIIRLDDGLYVGTRMIIVSDEISDEHRIGRILDEIRARRDNDKPTFICVYLATFRVTPSLLYDVIASLGFDYEVVTPIEFIRLLEGPSLEVVTRDPSGKTLGGYEVVIIDPEGKILAGQTDPEGRVHFYVEPGTFWITVKWQDFVVNRSVITVGEETVIDLICEVTGISVKIKDGIGLPAPGSKVAIYHFPAMIPAGEGRTNGRGEITFGELPKGQYLLVISSLGLETRHQLVLNEPREISLGVYLSIYSFVLYTVICSWVAIMLLLIRPRPTPLPKPQPREPRWVSQLSLDLEYQEIMSEIRMRELTIGKSSPI